MNGLWLKLLWPVAWKNGLLTVAPPVAVWVAGYHRGAILLLGWYLVFAVIGVARSRWLLRLLWRTRGFWRVRRGGIVLYYPPERTDAPAVLAALHGCANQLESLRGRFGFRLRRRLIVVLFPTGQEVAAIFRDPCGGRALPEANAILINQQDDPAELARHELVHLYSARWDVGAPPLLEEGLATWLQGTWGGAPVGWEARRVLSQLHLPLKHLLDRSYFFAPANRYACYILAAGFTEFLVRHYGWDRYRKVYKGARRHGTNYMLKKHVGRSLADLEQMWRDELGVCRARYTGGRLSEL